MFGIEYPSGDVLVGAAAVVISALTFLNARRATKTAARQQEADDERRELRAELDILERRNERLERLARERGGSADPDPDA